MDPPPPFRYRPRNPALFGYCLLLLYLSAFPFEFHVPAAGPGAWLVRGWYDELDAMDAVTNFLLFLPLGWLAARRWSPLRPRGLLVVLAGALALGMLLEGIQLFAPMRYASLWDVTMNSAGGVAGAVLAGGVSRRVGIPGSLAPVALALAWPAALLIPPLPAGLDHIADGLYGLLSFTPPPIGAALLQLAAWAAVTHLLSRGRVPAPARAAGAMLAVTCLLQVSSRAPVMPVTVWLAAAAGVLLGASPLAHRARALLVAGLLIAALVLDGLTPLLPRPTPGPFYWLPLHALVVSDPAIALRVTCEKVFLYGGLFWLLRDAGLTFGRSLAVGTALLALLEWSQRWMTAAHVAESTDPILFVALAFCLRGQTGADREENPPRQQ